ncbi:MAG: orotate phosphoribosyltransferase [Deltaproteobacteria bacterium]|nr:orotate phosphoribosyltransferase [Deltaproteobacteria bacterium]
MKNSLLEILYKKSFRFDPECGFTLASGKKSDLYVDVKKTLLSAEAMEMAGRALYSLIKEEDIEGVGGLTLGADSLAYASAMISNMDGKPMEVFIVRKEVKEHGTKSKIEGNLKEGARVVIFDDVATTGGSTIKAIERAKSAGYVVVKAVAFVDREEGGRENIEKYCPFEALFTRSDLLGIHNKKD